MAYLPHDLPLPQPTPDDYPYWEAHASKQLRIQRCTDCETFRHPPGPFCAKCGSGNVDWPEVSGRGEVFTYIIPHYATHPSLKQVVPYNVAVVMLEDAGDVRIVSNVVDAAPEEMHIGMKVALYWDPIANDKFLPRFRKV